jgi:hypothetical protein
MDQNLLIAQFDPLQLPLRVVSTLTAASLASCLGWQELVQRWSGSGLGERQWAQQQFVDI